MKKIVLICLTLMAATSSFSQKFVTKSGHIWFFSSAPLENIEAHNKTVASALDLATGDFIFKVLIKSFSFEKALMQQHFNENYLESETYPEATFKGKIIDIKNVNLKKDGVYNVTAEGDLTIHGVTKHVKVPGTLEVKQGKIKASAKFNILLADYNVKIPKAVTDNIAKNIDIHVDCMLEPSLK